MTLYLAPRLLEQVRELKGIGVIILAKSIEGAKVFVNQPKVKIGELFLPCICS